MAALAQELDEDLHAPAAEALLDEHIGNIIMAREALKEKWISLEFFPPRTEVSLRIIWSMVALK